MKKEMFIAILLGLGVGLFVSYGIYRARKSFLGGPSDLTEQLASPSPSSEVHNSLTLLSPDDESVQSTAEVKITGTTDPDALIVIFVNNKENVTHADSSGNFSIQTNLENGSNVIRVRTIDEDGNTVEVERVVIFTTQSLDEVPTATFSATPSPSPKTSVKPATTSATRP